MSHKKNRGQRAFGAGSAPLVHTMMPAEGGLSVVRHLNDQAAVFSDGSIRFNLRKFGPPQDQYDADVAWVQRSLGWVRLSFGILGDAGRLYSCVTVKYSPEAFFAHFWINSRAFHESIRKYCAENRMGFDPERDKITPDHAEADKRHVVTANFDVLARSGNEASMDFYHLPPAAVAEFQKSGEATGLKAVPKLRVLLSVEELLRLMNQCEPIVTALEPSVAALVKAGD